MNGQREGEGMSRLGDEGRMQGPVAVDLAGASQPEGVDAGHM